MQLLALSLPLTDYVILGESGDFSGFIFFLLNKGVAYVSPGALAISETWLTNIY